MNPDEIEIKVLRSADRRAVKKLYRQAGWWSEKDETPDGSLWIDAMVKGSFCFVGAFHRGKMIGMGRAISDGASDAYVQDVTVLKEFRGQGIGARIIRTIANFLSSRAIGWIGLVAEPGTQTFYQGLGFAVLEGYAPMRLEKKKD
jgi:ribosomal protein S18 acetylase RimI-like enzyme